MLVESESSKPTLPQNLYSLLNCFAYGAVWFSSQKYPRVFPTTDVSLSRYIQMQQYLELHTEHLIYLPI